MGDAINGKKLFMKLCAKCHTTEKGGKHMIGPNLHGIVGKTSGTISGYKSSPAMKEKAVVWDEKALSDYLAWPKKFIPGSSMVFIGVKKDEERKDLFAFLATLK
ncbi:PREDICTED: cytochrome c, testis-specific-like [Wasmannia auropunctata]|uniref:cytochrome c, testis-specific-like n=1 Tax=Wasmannia auropunctata TaxID=64793 RepID=UPI0005F061D8|nr:PREDICTED: cytochrome c, testis-specific-like [Wasmannia auropunctata]